MTWSPIHSSLLLLLFCLTTELSPWQQRRTRTGRILAALRDNLSHSLLAVLTWSISLNFDKLTVSDLRHLLLAGLAASLIDVDHFLAARSFSLKVRQSC